MHRTLALTLIVASSACASPASVPPSTQSYQPRELVGQLKAAQTDAHLPAILALVVSDRKTAFQFSNGVTRWGSAGRVSSNAYWHLGSAIKPFVAAAVVEEQRRGQVRLDSTLVSQMPEWQTFVASGYRGLTLRHLLQHRGGVPAYTEMTDAELAQLAHLPGSPVHQREGFARKILSAAPESAAPTAERQYSNAGYSIAAHFLEHRTGSTWQSLLARDVLAPARAPSCSAAWPPHRKGEPVGHHLTAESPLPVANLTVPAVLAPAGHLACRADDIARLMQFKLRQLRQCRAKADCDAALGLGSSKTKSGQPVFTILGSLDQYVLLLAFYPAQNRAVAMGANVGEEGGGRQKIVQLSQIVRSAFGL